MDDKNQTAQGMYCKKLSQKIPFLNSFSKYDMNRVNLDLETDKAYLEFAEPSTTMASTTASVASKTREAQQL